MATFETTGSAVIDSGDKRITRKVIVSTGGGALTPPGGPGLLTNVSVTNEAAGIRRGVFEYTEAGFGGGASGYNSYGKKIELLGGSREVPIYNHPTFAALTKEEILAVQKAVEERQAKSFTSGTQQKLFQFLTRGTEYFLAPSVVARVSELESTVPQTNGLCKVSNPTGVSAPDGTFWILTGLSATPVGNRYEVTREYTSIPAAWEDVVTLYNNW
jgi:hypothetical protein